MAAELAASPAPGKRPLQDLEPLLSNGEPLAKRACTDTPPVSAHLTLLEELCDLEGDDAESSLQPSSSVASTQEDLVAEMMKSLEKVIEEGENRGPGEASTSHAPSEAPSPLPDHPSVLDFTWTNEGSASTEQDPSSHGDFECEELNRHQQIQQILQVSDDELGIPFSSSSSDFEDGTFHEDWASLSDHGVALNFSWLDAPLQQFEEARELYEPVTLF